MTIDQSTGISLDPTSLQFNIFSADELRRISVLKIVTPRSFNEFGSVVQGGLHDLNLGPSLNHDVCFTCSKDARRCAGHFGHFEICAPVFNPFFLHTVCNVLRTSCISCYKLQIPDGTRSLLALQLRLVDAGYMVEAEELEIFKTKEQLFPNQVPPDLSYYTELLLREPHNKHGDTKNSSAIRTAIINHTMRECLQKKCIHCKMPIKKATISEKRLMINMSMTDMRAYYSSLGIQDPSEDDVKATKTVFIAQICKEHLRKLYESERELLPLLYPILLNTNQEHATDLFFMDVIPVSPPQMRPIRRTPDNQIIEHPQTMILRDIMLANITVRAVLSTQKPAFTDIRLAEEIQKVYAAAPGNTDGEKFYLAWMDLQDNVDELLDYGAHAKKLNNGQGLKQIIEKKEGLIRMHMMGKRVNHAARTVITPDPNIGVDEIGIPKSFAMKLTYPTPVTPWNVSELRKMVQNGPNIYPGATMVEDSNGYCSKVQEGNVTQRQSLAKLLLTPHDSNPQGFKIVYRHLLDGDILLLNRQPTLHRPSIMAHRAKILPGDKIFRLHYSNCKSYNADFDGDEMNAHFPQNEVARSEAFTLAAVPYQYLVPKDGTPLGGLIQDHIVAAVKLFIRGKFFNRDDYHQLVFQALHGQKGNLQLLPPTILKPVLLWSGKQIISTIIMNITPKGMPHINMIGTAKLSNKLWHITARQNWNAGGTPLVGNNMSETEVFIRNGELLVGILDKNHFGATPYGLIHCMYELYGGRCSSTLLSALSRLFTYYLQWEGFTLGVKDILVQDEADKKRSAIIAECRKIGHETTAAALDLPATVSADELNAKVAQAYARDSKFRSVLDRKFKTALDKFTNQINQACIPDGLISKFPQNNLQLMVQSGAKGSTVNTMQISALLGQIELEGKRPPLMMSGKALPSFASFETSPKSGGFIDGRFMTGIQPQDFFFHCMAGREGLIDTAVKTSRSGYLQRCLVKHLEGLNVQYDMTVRDSDNSIVQFMYGEDGLDILKSQFIESSKQMKFLDLNRDAIVQEKNLREQCNEDVELTEQLRAHVKKMKQWRKKNGTMQQKKRVSGFARFSADMAEKIRSSIPDCDTRRASTGRTKLTAKTIKKWQNSGPDVRDKYINNICARCPDPAVSMFRPDSRFDVLNEHLDELVKEYRKSGQAVHDMDELMKSKHGAAMISPGDPVGVLAAQSIGEPSTQMTLNTFHFAGRGEMNVTLGIPRLREILMLGSEKIKTPSMEIPLLPQKTAKLQAKIAEKLRKTLNRVTVADVLENIHIKSSLVLKPSRAINYIVRFNFLPQDAYSDNYRVQPNEIIRYMHRHFFKYMFRVIFKSAKNKNFFIEIDENSKKKRAQQEVVEDAEVDMKEPEERKVVKEENDGSSDEDDNAEIGEDADATEAKMKSKKSDDITYDTEEEEDKAESDDSGHESEPEQQPVVNEEDEANAAIQAEQALEMSFHLDAPHEKQQLKLQNQEISDYTFDTQEYRWCQVVFNMPTRIRDVDFTKIFKDIAGKCIIWEVPHIRRAITYTHNDQLYVKTDGINIHAMTKYKDILDLNRLYSNDIHAFAKMYGIEAATRVIVREIQNVFDVYGIKINPRHLLLIADYMTASGTYQAMNRKYMENSVSPLQQMSFESALRFIKLATVKGKMDSLNSPSSRLIVGQPCKSGTGAFTLYSSCLKDVV